MSPQQIRTLSRLLLDALDDRDDERVAECLAGLPLSFAKQCRQSNGSPEGRAEFIKLLKSIVNDFKTV